MARPLAFNELLVKTPAAPFAVRISDEHLRARGMLLRDGAGRPHLGAPIRFAAEPAHPDLSVPALGQHDAMLGAPDGQGAA